MPPLIKRELNPIFNIQPGGNISPDTSFFGEISNESFSYFLFNKKIKLIEALTVFHFRKTNSEHNVSGLLKKIFDEQSLLRNNYSNAFISYAFDESILTPHVYYNEGQNLEKIRLIYGDLTEGVILHDDIEERNLRNIYRVPADIHEVISRYFPAGKFVHQYSLLIKQLPNGGNVMKVIFYQQKIVITLMKNGMLQIVQTFRYTTAEDVVYHMLNTCNQFHTKQINIELSGMIEKNSDLFNRIHKYFLLTGFSHLPETLSYAAGIEDYPHHFFSHLFSIALCV